MQINVPGCILDGSTPATTTPTRNDIVVYQGVDTVIQVTVVGANGSPVNITGYTGVLMIKDRLLPTSGAPTTTKTYTATLTSPTTGVMQFAIPGSDLKALLLLGYWWDVFVTNAGKRDEVVLTGTMTVNAAIGA